MSVTMLPAGWRTQQAMAFFGPFVRPHEDCFTSRLRALITSDLRCGLPSPWIACFTHWRSALVLPVQLQAPAFR